MVYTSLDNPKMKDIKKLTLKKYRDREGLFLVEGEHLVLEAYKKGYLVDLILEENQVFPLNVNTYYVTKNILSAFSSLDSTPLVMGVVKKTSNQEKIGNRVLVLDGIQDPGNLGTIIRSAAAFRIDTIILSEDTVDLYNPKVVRSTQGLIFHMNIIRKKLSDVLDNLKSDGYTIYGTKVTHGSSLKSIEKVEKFAIIMGNEGNGMKEANEKYCNKFIYIPMDPVCESLNVGVATSIILYELDK